MTCADQHLPIIPAEINDNTLECAQLNNDSLLDKSLLS